ncbi:MAG: transposase [Byssovorax sp.]
MAFGPTCAGPALGPSQARLHQVQERGGPDATLAAALLAERDQMFAWWHRVRDGARPVDLPALHEADRVYHLLGEGMVHGSAKTMKTCRLLRKHADALWTFVYREGVEPTNNAAELRIRHAVLWRKTSYGTHSPDGSRFVERVLTAHATLRQQNRNVLDFLREACVAALSHAPSPSLLPQPT